MMVVERWKGKNNKNRSQKEKEKDFGGKWERKLRDAHIFSPLVCAFCFKGILI